MSFKFNPLTGQLDITNPPIQGLTYIQRKEDFPEPVSGVITLQDNWTYFLTGTIDLAGDRIVSGQNTTLLGGSSENCRLKSTGLVDALITSQWSIPMRGLTLEAEIALDLDANGNVNQAIDWFGVNFTNCTSVGRIANYNNFIMTDCALLNSSGMVFDGTIGTVGFSQCLFDGQTGTIIQVPSTAVITRRFRMIYSSMIALAGETALDVSVSATIPVEGYILDTINFSGGGNYISGIQYNDNKALFLNCRGIDNSSASANYYMTNNLIPTPIVSTGVAVKALGLTTGANLEKFEHTSNRATYIGALVDKFKITATVSVESGNNNQIGCYIAKNNILINESEVYSTTSGIGRAENITIQAITQMSTNDFIEVWVENSTTVNPIKVTFLNLIISR